MSENQLKDNIGSTMFKDKVSICRCPEYKIEILADAIENCVAKIGGFKKFIRGAKKILLKPNLLSPSKPELAVTTHPLFIEAVIQLIKKYSGPGCSIIIADSPGVSTGHTKKELLKLYKQCGLTYLDRIENVSLNIDCNYLSVSFKDGVMLKKMDVIKPALDADIIINLPKFKTHSLTRITGAVKNMFGIIYGRTKTLLHAKFMDTGKFSNMLLDVYLYKKPVLNIMDGILGMEGEGPGASGIPRNTGLVLASSNALALDNVMAQLMNFNILDIPLLRNAKERHLNGWDPSVIELCGGNIGEFTMWDYRIPKISPLDHIAQNRVLNTYLMPFIRNNLSVSPYQDKTKCTLCGICIEICPENAIEEEDKKLVFDYKKCIRCYCCSEMCPEGAIELKYSFIGNLIFGRKNIK
ncbi:MAG: DUF362 domain-containing protein [Actinobacteria bacterium]|nr:DUF362 domain-containing protein [Actinomycetota bacterium]